MDDILDRLQGMKAKDWAIDVAIAAAAFVVACVQLMLTVSSIVFPDLALRQYLGLVNVVPEFGVFVALALTTLPLVLRRVAPWLVFAVVLVLHCSLQSLYASLGLSPIGLLIALFTVAAQRTIAEAAAAALLAIGGLLLFSGAAVVAQEEQSCFRGLLQLRAWRFSFRCKTSASLLRQLPPAMGLRRIKPT